MRITCLIAGKQDIVFKNKKEFYDYLFYVNQSGEFDYTLDSKISELAEEFIANNGNAIVLTSTHIYQYDRGFVVLKRKKVK